MAFPISVPLKRPEVIKEEILATRGGWVIRGRIVIYHDRVRRAEIVLEHVEDIQDVGWTAAEINQLMALLENFKKRNGELLGPLD
jgi:hypothetical protein